jgi:hypothetical protein
VLVCNKRGFGFCTRALVDALHGEGACTIPQLLVNEKSELRYRVCLQQAWFLFLYQGACRCSTGRRSLYDPTAAGTSETHCPRSDASSDLGTYQDLRRPLLELVI